MSVRKGVYVMGAAESTHNDFGTNHESAPVSLLLLEDVSVTAGIECSYFASVGFNVSTGSNVVDAEAMIAREWVDIVIVDAGFARKKGIDLIPILQRRSRNQSVKIIVTSVSGDIALKKAATAAGAHAFIVKPAPRPRYLKEIKKLTAQKVRDTERVHQSLSVQMSWSGGRLNAQTLDLSSEGIHLSIEGQGSVIPVGTSLDLLFQVEGKQLKLSGEVVRHTPKGVGVRFTSIGVQAQRTLDKFLLRHSIEHQASHFYL